MKIFWLSVFFLAPAVAFAAARPTTINQVLATLLSYGVEYIIPVFVLVGFIIFLSGIIRFIRAGDNEEMRQSGRSVMIFGIVVLFVMISFWGFVGLLTRSFLGENLQLNNYLPLQN